MTELIGRIWHKIDMAFFRWRLKRHMRRMHHKSDPR